MTIEAAVQKIGDIGIVTVVRAATTDEARRAIDAIYSGGIPIIEITMTVPNAYKIMKELCHRYGSRVLVGAGTVMSAEQAQNCLDSGAEFLVSPGLSMPVLRVAAARNALAIPGALTPTEVMKACDGGARVIKLFPCGSVGGPKHLKSLKGPFPKVSFIPTGGVNIANAAEYMVAGAFALGVGADLVDLEAIRKNKSEKIVDAARGLIEAVRDARATLRFNRWRPT